MHDKAFLHVKQNSEHLTLPQYFQKSATSGYWWGNLTKRKMKPSTHLNPLTDSESTSSKPILVWASGTEMASL